MPVGTLVYAIRHAAFFGTIQECPRDFEYAHKYTWIKPLNRENVWEGILPKNVYPAIWTFAGPSVL